jgi:hypothetical protein
MAAKKQNLVIRQGETFLRVIRWETPPFIYKPITAITQSAPVGITAVGHGLASGWRAVVVSVLGMDEINAHHNPPREHEFKPVTVTGNDAITINTINSSEFDAYTSGGYLQFYTPVDMTSYTARLTIKNKVGGTVLLALTSPTDIAIDNALHTITITISATATAALTWKTGVYDMEMVAPSGVVTTIFTGNVSVTQEVTA